MSHIIVHIALILGLPPLLLGVIGKTKALFAGRVGPPVLQPYYDLARLFRKGSVFSTTTTWVFRAGPVVGLVTALLAGMLVPLGSHGAPVSFNGDLILFAYLFALGRFFTAAAALDTGSSFEGMGAAREVTFSCLAEPALFFGFLVLAKLSGALSLTGMLDGPFHTGWGVAGASLVLVSRHTTARDSSTWAPEGMRTHSRLLVRACQAACAFAGHTPELVDALELHPKHLADADSHQAHHQVQYLNQPMRVATRQVLLRKSKNRSQKAPKIGKSYKSRRDSQL